MTRQQVQDKAREYLGTPFHHQARLKGVGVDCVGLVVCLMREFGQPVQDYTQYGRMPTSEDMAKATSQLLLLDRSCRPGDVVLLWIRKPTIPCHLAVVTDKGLLHVPARPGFCVEHGWSDFYTKRIVGVYSIPGTED